MTRLRWSVLSGALLLEFPLRAATAQVVSITPPAAPAPAEQAVIARLVTLDVREAPLADVLRSLAQQSGLDLVYSNDDLAGKRVTVTRRNVAPMVALRDVLRGTGLGIKTASDGRVAIVKSSGRAAQDSAYGVVLGEVIEAVKQRGVGQVRVAIDGTKLSAVRAKLASLSFRVFPPASISSPPARSATPSRSGA